LVHAGAIPAARLGSRRFLILRDDLERYFAAQAVVPASHESLGSGA